MKPWTLCALLRLLLPVAVTAVSSRELQCSMSPAAALHPVQAQLERFEAGTGCAAREGGAKETHVISVGKAYNKQVTVVLRPLTSRPLNRPVILVLSSQHALHWVLENEGLSHNVNVLVQVSLNSTVESPNMSIRVTPVSSLPRRPRVLLRWILQRHATVSSLTHTAHANRVYLRLGEDPSMPSECRLRPMFLSQNYLVSELQEQDVHGCVPSEEPSDTEVHVIRLWSSGSGLCGSLQVEVSVSLLPPDAPSAFHRIVLILSSAVAVNWALVAPEVKSHVRVYSSNSVSLPYRTQASGLTMASTVTSDLLSTPDLLEWANQKGFPRVSSYTEADLANRFVIRLREGAADSDVRPSDGRGQNDIMIDSSEALSSQCEGGVLTVTLDTQMLKGFPVMSVMLRDHDCRGEFNGSHFLLVFPVISCGTEGEMDEANGRVHYTNTVFLWKQKPSLINGTDGDALGEKSPLAVHLSCQSSLSAHVSPTVVIPSVRPEEALHPSPAPAPPWIPETQSAPLLSMELFVTEAYEKRAVGPCVVTALDRVYVQISVGSAAAEAVDLQSCLVSPLSDPQAHSGWSVIKDSCPSDASFTLTHRETTGSDKEESDEDEEEEKTDRKDNRRPRWRHTARDESTRRFKDRRADRLRGRRPEERRRRRRDDGRQGSNALRFSFILRPIFNNSIQFLHCRLRLCAADEGPSGAAARVCANGPQIPALTHTPASQQCEDRNLSRPVLVTSPVGLLAPPAGKLAQKPAEMSRQTPLHGQSEEGLVLVVVFAAFMMGLCLMGALWCIYTHTGRHDLTQRDAILDTTGFRNSQTLTEQSSFHDN